MAWRPKRGEEALGASRSNLRDFEEAAARAALRGGAEVVAQTSPTFPGRTRVWQDVVRAHVATEFERAASRIASEAASASTPVLALSRASGLRDAESILSAFDVDYLGKRRAAALSASRITATVSPVVQPLPNPGYVALFNKKVGERLAEIPVGTPKTEALELAKAALRDTSSDLAWITKRDARVEVSRNYNAEVLDHLRRQDSPGDRMYKRLVEIIDERTGKDSVILNNQTVLVDQPFEDWWFGGTYDHPPNRYNDRATVAPWRRSYGTPPVVNRPTIHPVAPRDRPLPTTASLPHPIAPITPPIPITPVFQFEEGRYSAIKKLKFKDYRGIDEPFLVQPHWLGRG